MNKSLSFSVLLQPLRQFKFPLADDINEISSVILCVNCLAVSILQFLYHVNKFRQLIFLHPFKRWNFQKEIHRF